MGELTDFIVCQGAKFLYFYFIKV